MPEPDAPDADGEPDERPQRRREWRGPLPGLVVPVAVLAGVGAFVWFLAGHPGVSLAGSSGTGSIAVGQPAPDFTLPQLDGTQLRLSDLRGKPVIVNFWASWCGPCRDEIPQLVALHRQHATDLTIVGVDLQEDAGSVRSFVNDFGMSYPVVLDTHGATIRPYHITGPPTSVFIDASGTVRKIVLGPLAGSDLEADIAAIAGPASGG